MCDTDDMCVIHDMCIYIHLSQYAHASLCTCTGTSKENPKYSAWSASMCGKHCRDAREDDKLSVSVVARAAEVLGLSPDLAEGVIVSFVIVSFFACER